MVSDLCVAWPHMCRMANIIQFKMLRHGSPIQASGVRYIIEWEPHVNCIDRRKSTSNMCLLNGQLQAVALTRSKHVTFIITKRNIDRYYSCHQSIQTSSVPNPHDIISCRTIPSTCEYRINIFYTARIIV